MVSMGPDLDICNFCNSTMDEWSYPVNIEDTIEYGYMIDNDNFEVETV